MDFVKEYNEKLLSVEEALSLVKSNYEIVCSLGPCEPQMFLSNLHTIKNRVKNVTIVTMLSLIKYKYNTEESMKGHFFNESLFMGGAARNSQKMELCSYIPTHLRYSATRRLKYRKPNIFVGAVTPMDKHGFFSLSLSLVYERENIDAADIIILEVNPNLPRVHGDTQIHISEVDHLIESSCKIPELEIKEPSEKEIVIGKYISELVDDGATLQLGIGGIPNAVAMALKEKKNLGIHTEMITEGIVDLFEAGVITNTEKTLHKNKIIGTFALGSKKLYEFLDDNPGIELKKCSYVNNPYVISKNKKMVSINTTLAVDLTGQCASESFGYSQYSGTGGQGDTGIGAFMAEGGKSIIALKSTVKNDTISTICMFHEKGSAISFSRNDVDYIVTEYGVANLTGKSIKERAESLIKIAHPKFRNELKEFAIKNKLI
ncbi:acetyl-CoA hydrolase/transferase C-terminal domain-containing protein [uncultured Clostridium sp.]|uniref:acetyl-CoA hydrolase/transferase family protein n=1 Tax=uncultured Clostridium sp. TaxID=59620 RepID=UPI00262E6091|nr:acetyl-CoA hydrolase/transferase C-terminal domain-containing protein [uncultured Clostridium sp.]